MTWTQAMHKACFVNTKRKWQLIWWHGEEEEVVSIGTLSGSSWPPQVDSPSNWLPLENIVGPCLGLNEGTFNHRHTPW